MLTLYGDYLLNRREEIGIGSLITLFGNFGLSGQAVRSAVSRMCHTDILKVRSEGRKSYYSLTERGHKTLPGMAPGISLPTQSRRKNVKCGTRFAAN